MGQRLGVYRVLACLVVATSASTVAAQSASPPPQSPPPTQTAPAPAPAVSPAAAASAPPAGTSDPGAIDKFNLIEALKGRESLTSKEAAEQAAKTAPSVARAEAAAQRAALAAEQAYIAVYPRLELEARYTRVSPITPPPQFAGLIRFQENQGLLQARLSWPVSTLFFSILPRHKGLEKAAEAAQIQTLVSRQSVKLQAREAYYNYARTRAALMVAKAALAQAEAHRKDSDALVSAGSIARVELMRADAQVAAAKVAQARAEFLVGTARSALFTLIHKDGTEDVTIADNIEEDLPAGEAEKVVYQRALERRSELRALRVQIEAQERSVDAARGQALPVFAIGGTAEEANPNQRYFGTYNQWKGSWALFASLVWSPNETFTGLKAMAVARAEIAQTQADYAQLKDALRIEVSQAYNAFSSAHAALDAARAGIAAAEESYRVRREQFRAGAAIAVDVLDSEAQLRQNRLDLVNAWIDMRIAKARLDRAVEAE